MADVITPTGGGGAVAMPHLDDGIVTEILHRLPTKDAYRFGAVCPRWHAVLSQPTFLCRHLSPRPLPDDRPYALIVQPVRKIGFTHLTIVATDPGDRVPVNIPIQPKYMPTVPGADGTGGAPGKAVAGDIHENSVVHPKDEEPMAASPDLPADGAVPAENSWLPPPVEAQVEDYVVFFERTVPLLDISVVASHGRLLLGRSRSRYYVCDPAANRWLALPPCSIPTVSATNSGLHYEVDKPTGRLAFTVVLLVRRRHRRVLVETFSSTTGRWDSKDLAARGAARYLGAASPGIHAGACFYWLGRFRGRILRYDAARGRTSVLREPPLADEAKGRLGRSLGSVRGQLRLCTFDIRDEEESDLPHDDLEGVHGVWLMDGPTAAWSWRRVHESVVEDISAYYFKMLFGEEKPVDFAGACDGAIVVDDSWGSLLWFDLESGSKVTLANLEMQNKRLQPFYYHYNVFPFFL